MQNFDYILVVKSLRKKGRRRESAFIQKMYIEHKDMKTIRDEMFLNSRSAVYVLKIRCKKLLLKQYGINVFLSDDEK